MGIGMVHHLMPGVVQRLHALRVFIHPFADDKERRLHAVLSQNIYELLRVLVAPCRVERETDEFSVPLDAVYGQFPLRDRRADDTRRVYESEDRRNGKHQRRAGGKLAVPREKAAEFSHHHSIIPPRGHPMTARGDVFMDCGGFFTAPRRPAAERSRWENSRYIFYRPC